MTEGLPRGAGHGVDGLGGSGSNADNEIQNLGSCHLDDPRRRRASVPAVRPATLPSLMGSLIKKRRKRMRKKKHKKMLKKTRWQRRAAGK